ncbi:putative membrane protein (plasmid) [Rhizobium favelukesii]|uniref:Membrane protein n=2 Tax=Rhizobium/Agrobacterium group TaxID=227290 RepID=W6RPU9_9HYPH|nr:putative membrane protein [Rhizobium favelukesii]
MSTFDVAALLVVAGFALGALSISGFLWVRPIFQQRDEPVLHDDARDLAMRIVLILDDFVGSSHAAAMDFPEIDLNEPSNFFLHSDNPVLLLPKDANWTLLGRELSDEIRWLPNRLRNVLDALESIEIDPPDFNDLFEHRQEDFARLGLRAMDLIERLCSEYGLPLPERPAYFDPRKGLVAKLREMEEFWKRRVQSAERVPSGASNITPIFGRNGSPENQSK